MRLLRYCFSFSGRLNRANFWIGYGIAFLMTMVPVVVIETTIPDNTTATLIGGGWCILWFVSICAVATKRLHDIDHSGLALLAFFALLVALTLFMRGQNRELEGLVPGIG